VLFLVSFTTIEAQEEKTTKIKYAQLVVRDSEGTLVTYLETSHIRQWSSERIENSINSDSTRIINSEKFLHSKAWLPFERIIFEKEPHLYITESQRGVTILGNSVYRIAASFMNEGHFQLPEDHVTVFWSAIRSIVDD